MKYFLCLVLFSSTYLFAMKPAGGVRFPALGTGRAVSQRSDPPPPETAAPAPHAGPKEKPDEANPPPTALVRPIQDFEDDDDAEAEAGDETSSSIVESTLKEIRMNLYQFRGFLNLLSNAVIVATQTGKIVVANEAAAHLFGYPVGVLEGDQRLGLLSLRERGGLHVTALMPQEIAAIHHFLMERRVQSGEQRIGKAPRKIVIKVRTDTSIARDSVRDISQEIKRKAEQIFLYDTYLNPGFMETSSFAPQTSFKFHAAFMTLGEIRLGASSYYIAFFDTSSIAAAMAGRRASIAARLAIDAVGDERLTQDLISAGGSSHAIAPTRRPASVVFVDIVGSTVAMCGRSAEEVFADLNKLYADFDKVVLSKPTAVKVKVTGDGYILAVGICPKEDREYSQQDYAATALEIGQSFLAIAKEHNFCGSPVNLRIGIHSGDVMVGILGTTKKTLDILGADASIAARMESKGRKGQIQISAATQALLPPIFQGLFIPRMDHGIRKEEYPGQVFITHFE